jgi:predicted DsbA family dithiol-disulfide isomerase
VRQAQEAPAARCRELGLTFQPSEMLYNSRLAIEAAEHAREAGRHVVFHRALLAAYFAGGLDIGDIAVLEGVATEVGLDGPALREALTDGRYTDKRVAAENEARRLRITAVPTFLFEEGPRVIGAQSLDYFRELLLGESAQSGA